MSAAGCAVEVESGEGGVRPVGIALVGRFAGVEFGVDDETVLEVVNAEFGGFAEADRAKVSSDFETAFVCGFDGGAEFRAGDVHVGLVGGDTAIGPEVDHLASVVGTGELMHLRSEGTFAFEIRTGDVDLGPNGFAGIYEAFDFEIGERFDAACGAHGGDTGGEVEARKGLGHFAEERECSGDGCVRSRYVGAEACRRDGCAFRRGRG